MNLRLKTKNKNKNMDDDGALLSNEKKRTVDTSDNLDESEAREKAASEGYILYESLYTAFGKDKSLVINTSAAARD